MRVESPMIWQFLIEAVEINGRTGVGIESIVFAGINPGDIIHS